MTLAWAVTIYKCQGLTLPEIAIDMTPAKGKFKPGEVYVAFSRVRTLEILHIITCRKRDEKAKEKHLATNAIKSISYVPGGVRHKYWKFQKQNRRYEK